jgi:hypothetical protein
MTAEPATDSLLPTRQSLLARLRDWHDQAGWREFFETYWRLIYNVARRTGLPDAEAQDVVQNTFIYLARRMPNFRYEPWSSMRRAPAFRRSAFPMCRPNGFTLIRKTTAGAITGTFNGYPEGALRMLGDIPVVMSYRGGDGNDVTLTVTNLAVGAAGSQVVSGNGNGLIEPDECNLIFLGVQNHRDTPITISNAVLRSVTPGAVVTIAVAAYPAIPAASIRTNLTPFQLRTLPSFPCGTPVAIELQVTIADEGTFAIPFTLLEGAICTNGGGACESCTIVSGRFTTNTPTLFRRLLATGGPSICFPQKLCSGPDDGTNLPPARYLKHAFTNFTGSDACLTAQLHFDCPTATVGTLHAAAYLGDIDSSTACLNYLGDTGAAIVDSYPPFSFRVPAGSNFVLVVTTRVANIACDSYWLELFGLPCPPPRLQIAKDAPPDKVLLQWSTAYPDWSLQSTNTLHSPGSSVFRNVITPPVIHDGKYTVTNTSLLPSQFFLLVK